MTELSKFVALTGEARKKLEELKGLGHAAFELETDVEDIHIEVEPSGVLRVDTDAGTVQFSPSAWVLVFEPHSD